MMAACLSDVLMNTLVTASRQSARYVITLIYSTHSGGHSSRSDGDGDGTSRMHGGLVLSNSKMATLRRRSVDTIRPFVVE